MVWRGAFTGGGVLTIVLRLALVGIIGLGDGDVDDFLSPARGPQLPLRVKTVVEPVGVDRGVANDSVNTIGLYDP